MSPLSPTPWTVQSPPNDPHGFDVHDATGRLVHKGFWGGEADARLMAAAPAILAALKAMVASYDGLRDALTCKTVLGKLAAADAAIAAVEGVK